MQKSKNLAQTVRGAAGDEFTVSLDQDRRLWRIETAVSRAHAKMLAKQGIIGRESLREIERGLDKVEQEIADNTFKWRTELEDIHLNIEARLEELIGENAHKLHTGRSRNDQIATLTRIATKEYSAAVLAEIKQLCKALVKQADAHGATIMPGYTHLQRGQPVTLAHHLLAYWEMLNRDRIRFNAVIEQADSLPLGAGALAGTTFEIDPAYVAKELGFARVSRNSMDAVSDRDYLIDFISASALAMTHLARLAEELILWASAEFNFVKLAAEHTTGSSMMPQKRNPDYAELVRGRVGIVYGALINSLTMMKGLPLTYNRDMQEDKKPLFESADTLTSCLKTMAAMVGKASFNEDAMLKAVEQSAALATDYADYLVNKGMPFREAYALVKKIVAELPQDQPNIGVLGVEKLRSYSDLFDKDIGEWTVSNSVNRRRGANATAPDMVAKRIAQIKAEMEQWG